MSCPPHAEWSDLAAELDYWSEAGMAARLWWRDDDAVAPSPLLDRLLVLADGIPLVLAVIPAAAGPPLAAVVAAQPQLAVVQHGWGHVNHAGTGRKSEYPAGRPAAEVAAELAAGQARLGDLFGERAVPVLAPPWNRFADELMPLLPGAGIAALSQMAPRRGMPPPEVTAVDVDLDVVAWRQDRGFVGEAAALTRLIGALRERRCGTLAPATPVGLLTHHLVMDRATEVFAARLAATIAAHPGARWTGIAELMAPQ